MGDESATQATSRAASSTITAKRKSTKPRSDLWNHFTKFTNEEGQPKARCNYCTREYHVHGTTSLNYHRKVCKKISGSPDLSQADGLGSWKFDQESIRRSVTRMVIIDELPFNFVEGRGFKECMLLACPRFRIPSRWTVTRDCYSLYMDEKIKLKKLFDSSSIRVSLTTDTWTSIQRVNYMCLTAHFIDDDWKLRKKIINFCPISSHRGEAIGRAIEKCLRDWGIDKVFTITVDNASSNDVAISYLRRKFNQSGTSILDGRYLHMRCIAHIVNLIVSDGLKEFNDSVARVRGQ